MTQFFFSCNAYKVFFCLTAILALPHLKHISNQIPESLSYQFWYNFSRKLARKKDILKPRKASRESKKK